MKKVRLLPQKMKKLGWFIFLPSVFLGIVSIVFDRFSEFGQISFPVVYDSGFLSEKVIFGFSNIDWYINLIGILIIIGGLIVGFSEEKIEDEYIASLRLNAVLWSLLVSYIIVLALFFTIYGTAFFNVMIVAMYLPLVLYIMSFNYLLNKR